MFPFRTLHTSLKEVVPERMQLEEQQQQKKKKSVSRLCYFSVVAASALAGIFATTFII